ncbi:MAG: bifunctional pyr operon transcriptional regulator/uracil phosphoribosyltransferase PyrR [Ktedonobacterales bacterium]
MSETAEKAETTTEKIIFNEDEMRRAISRIAHEIVERNSGAGNLTLIGLRTRGGPLARRLAAKISELEHVSVPIADLDVTDYRDDLPDRNARATTAGPDHKPLSVAVTDRVIVLVDDVLFTGRTTRAALEALLAHGRPQKVQLAVLVDRGHRELPIRADYVGKNVPTALRERIAVRLCETDGADAVALCHEPEKTSHRPDQSQKGEEAQ